MPDRNHPGPFAFNADGPFLLSARQGRVLCLAAEGRTCTEIGFMLGIRPRTVRKHLYLARRSLGAVNTTQAVALAVAWGVIFMRCLDE